MKNHIRLKLAWCIGNIMWQNFAQQCRYSLIWYWILLLNAWAIMNLVVYSSNLRQPHKKVHKLLIANSWFPILVSNRRKRLVNNHQGFQVIWQVATWYSSKKHGDLITETFTNHKVKYRVACCGDSSGKRFWHSLTKVTIYIYIFR